MNTERRKRKSKAHKHFVPTLPPSGFAIRDWCAQVSLGRATFYLLENEAKPRHIRVGKRIIVTESPARWLQRVTNLGGVSLKRAVGVQL